MAEQPLSDIEKEYIRRYKAAGHAMQSGVAMKMNYDAHETTPKHLRVGVNSAMVDSAAIGKLLIDKGIITREEYLKALCEGMEAEAKSYEVELNKSLVPTGGPAIKLG